MKTLPAVTATPEQLRLISNNSLGAEVIRGAAGSGKTSTAILRLRSLAYMFEERRNREGRAEPVRILVLTFNRTLSGYVRTLVDEQVHGLVATDLTVDTFGRWAMQHLGMPPVIRHRARENKIRELAEPIAALSPEYVFKEVDYLLGRFRPDRIDDYLTAERTGRGTEPRVDRALRQRILSEVVYPYLEWLSQRGELDWNGVAVRMADSDTHGNYDVVIVDESQDFSANQLRAVRHHVADPFSVTFVIDTIQRIYARGFTWLETGFVVAGGRFFTLQANHRNTRQIAAFAAGILQGMAPEADGSLPNLATALRDGSSPTVLLGLYNQQEIGPSISSRRASTCERKRSLFYIPKVCLVH